MNELCILTNLTSSEVAAWVQAVGSLLALGVAFFVVWWQHRQQLREQERKEWTKEYDHLGSILGVLRFAEHKVESSLDAMADPFTFQTHIQANLDVGDLSRMREVLNGLPSSVSVRPTLKLELLVFRDAFADAYTMLEGLKRTGVAYPQTGEQFAGWVQALKKIQTRLEGASHSFQRERERMLTGDA